MAKKKKNEVCLSDETLNDWGFIVLTAGISLERFLKQPVLLAEHNRSLESVLGLVVNLRVEDSKLIGELQFDTERERPAEIAGMWERGVLNSVSIGFSFNAQDVIQNPDGTFVITKCELYELSIVTIGSNKNAVRLYSNDTEKLIEGNELQATLSSLFNQSLHVEKHEITTNQMAKITLSAIALASTLGLKTVEVEQSELETKITELNTAKLQAEADAKKYKERIEAIETAELTTKKNKADAFVTKLVSDGKLKASDTTEIERFRKLATDDYDFAVSLSDKMAGKSNLNSRIDNQNGHDLKEENETFDYLQKKDAAKLASIRENEPERYAKLAADYKAGVRYKKS